MSLDDFESDDDLTRLECLALALKRNPKATVEELIADATLFENYVKNYGPEEKGAVVPLKIVKKEGVDT
ncbi:MAG: hypothetical protein FJX23_03095 [Alphaproteobacteria bacterium]|nr:hypothetical protein [Alphaproteobacteria bacterium]